MPIPQLTDRIKEAPAIALRAIFAGVGQVLLAVDKLRAELLDHGDQARSGQAAGTAARPAAPPPAEPAEPAGAAGEPGNVRVLREPARPATARPATAKPAGPAAAAAPPLVNYDELTIASLRARLRGLDAAGVRGLLDYEKSHANREAVVTMYERRLHKLAGEAG